MIKRYNQNNRLSQLVISKGYFESAGQVSENHHLNTAGQTKEILAKIDSLLDLINANKSNITRVQIWLNDMNDFDEMNAVYEKWLEKSPKPARACVGSTLANGYKVEIQVFGYIKS